MSFGASHRKIGETQRLYFDSDFLDRLDSLFLVEGDQLPELKVELTRRLSPEIVATLSSNVGSGGGGLMQTGGRKTYENEVRYLVTSVDTPLDRPQQQGHQLRNIAANLALHLNMEISRGGSSSTSILELEELRKRVTGGVAVRF